VTKLNSRQLQIHTAYGPGGLINCNYTHSHPTFPESAVSKF